MWNAQLEWLPTEENLTQLLRDLPACPIVSTSSESRANQLATSAAADKFYLKAIGLKFLAFVENGLNSSGFLDLIISVITVLVNRAAAWDTFEAVQAQLSDRLKAIGTPFQKPSLLAYLIDENNGTNRLENTVVTENLLTGLAMTIFMMRGVVYHGNDENLHIWRNPWYPNESQAGRWYKERCEETFRLAEDVRSPSRASSRNLPACLPALRNRAYAIHAGVSMCAKGCLDTRLHLSQKYF